MSELIQHPGRASETGAGSGSSPDWKGLFHRLFSASRDGVLIADPSGRVIDANQKFVDRLGVAHADLIGRSFANILAPDGAGGDGEHLLCKKGGSLIYLPVLVDRLAGGGLIATLLEKHEAVHGQNLTPLQWMQLALACIEHAPIGIYRFDSQGKILDVNMQVEKDLGYDRSELVGRPIFEIDPNSSPETWRKHREDLKEGESRTFESVHQRKDGARFPVEISINQYYFQGDFQAYAFIKDITSFKVAEEALKFHESELVALNEISLEINTQKDVSKLLDAIIERATRLANAPMGGIYIMRPDGQSIELVSSYHLPGSYLGTVLKLGEGLSGLIAQTGQILTVEDYQAWPNRADAYRGSSFHRILGVPLKIGEQVIGVINVADTERVGPYDAWEIQLLTQFANQAAVAIQNARLYETAQHELIENKRAHQIQEALYRISEASQTDENLDQFFQKVHQAVSGLMPAVNFYIALYDPAADRINFPYFVDQFDPAPPLQKPGDGLTEIVLRSGQPILITPTIYDELTATSQVKARGIPPLDWLGVPLKIHQVTIGVMAVMSYDLNVRYSLADQEILSFISNQVAMAIERKQTEKALQDSEYRYRQLFENAPVGILVVSSEGVVLEANQMSLNILGAPPGANPKVVNMLSFPPLIEAGISGNIRAAVSTNRTIEAETTYRSQWGKVIQVHYFVVPLVDPTGQPTLVQILVEDITTRKEMEESLRQTIATLHTLVQSSPLAIAVRDAANRLILWNPAAERMFGWKAEEVLGKPIPYIPKTKKAEFKGLSERTDAGESITGVEIQRLKKDGTPIDISLSTAPMRDASGRVIGVLGMHVDITERKRAELLLQTLNAAGLAMERASSLDAAFKAVAKEFKRVGFFFTVFALDAQRQLLTPIFTSYSEKIYRSVETLLDKRLNQMSFDVNAIDAYRQTIQERRSIYSRSLIETLQEMVTPNLRTIINPMIKRLGVVKSITAPLIVENEVIGLITIESNSFREKDVPAVTASAHQIAAVWRQFQLYEQAQQEIVARMTAETQVRGLNEELEERVADRTAALQALNKELEAFSYSVSHDLRAPLRAVDGYTRVLLEGYQDRLDEEGQRICGVIRSETLRMNQLIDDLLAFSRINRVDLNLLAINMGEMVQSVYKDLTTLEEPGRLDFILGNLPAAEGDPRLIYQVWINLLSNALKFSSKKERAVIEVGSLRREDETVYFVRDNGAGFNPQYADKLFGVFQRLHSDRDFPGTGVGLAIVQRIISRHHGRVWADAAPDQGATFYFTIPQKGINEPISASGHPAR